MAYVHSTEHPNCLSVEMEAQIKDCSSHEYHLTEPRKAAGLMDSSQFIQVVNENVELTPSDSMNLPLKDLWPFANILIGLKRPPTLIKNAFNLCLI